MRELHAGERGSAWRRRLDRYIGIPIVVAIGLLRRRVVHRPSEAQTIGLLKTAGIGDTTILSAAVADLRLAYPNARLVLLTGRENFAIGKEIPGLDEVLALPLDSPIRLLQSARSLAFDYLLDFGPWPRVNAIVAAMARTGCTVGFRTAGQYRHFAYDIVVEHSSGCHELENYRSVVRAIGADAASYPRLVADRSLDTLPERFRPPARYVVFHPWPGGWKASFKEWPRERWRALGRLFADRGYTIVLTGGSSDKVRNDELSARADYIINCAGCAIDQTLTLLRHAALVVSVNTGIMHMAAALRAPVVGLHGPTSSKRWGPVGEHAIAVDSPLDGCGYLSLGFEYPAACRCMEAISVETVFATCIELFASVAGSAMEAGPESARAT